MGLLGEMVLEAPKPLQPALHGVSYRAVVKAPVRKLPRASCLMLSDLLLQMQQKVVTSEIFRGRKEGYAESLHQPFARSRLGERALWEGWGASPQLSLSREERRPSWQQAGGDSSCSGSLPR